MSATIDEKNYVAPAGLQRLKDEHKFLLTRERPAVTAVVAWAAGNGDRSENADYQYGKRRLRQIDKRIRFLTKRINAAADGGPGFPRSGRAATPVFFSAAAFPLQQPQRGACRLHRRRRRGQTCIGTISVGDRRWPAR